MKKDRTLPLVGLLLAFCFVLNSNGQEREIPVYEIGIKAQKAEMWVNTVTCRSTMTIEDFDEKNKDWTVRLRFMRENVPPDRSHSVTHYSPTSSIRRLETARIGDRRYRKVDDNAWEELKIPAVPTASADATATAGGTGGLSAGVRTPPKISSTAKFIEQTTLENQSVTVYEIRTIPTSAADDTIAKLRTARYWLRADGLILKKVEEVESAVGKLSRVTTLYEYDNIKIDEPVITKKTNN